MYDEESLTWDDHANTWDTQEPVRLYAAKAFASLQEHVLPSLPNLATGRAFDFGCGTGLLTTQLAPLCHEVVALELSSKMVGVLDAKVQRDGLANVTTLVGNLENQTPDEFEALRKPFDLIVASSVCAFLNDFEAAVKMFADMLSPGGVFVQWDWVATEDEPDFGFSKERIALAYHAAGLKVVRIEPTITLELAENKTMTALMGMGRAVD